MQLFQFLHFVFVIAVVSWKRRTFHYSLLHHCYGQCCHCKEHFVLLGHHRRFYGSYFYVSDASCMCSTGTRIQCLKMNFPCCRWRTQWSHFGKMTDPCHGRVHCFTFENEKWKRCFVIKQTTVNYLKKERSGQRN